MDESSEVSISHAAQTIANAFQFKGELKYDTTFSDGQYKKTASNAKLRSFLPDFKFTNFDEAINDTIKWYVNNQDIVRK